jgi:GT2 family glycosyltransferase
VILEPDYLAILTRVLEEDPRLGWAAGKLVRPDGRIDSAGEVIKRNRRIVNRGEEEADMGQYDQREEVFGVSAAAALYRRSMLDDVRLAGEVFDSDYFAYLEDSDLNWRCQNAGWRCLYEPRARAVHARGHATGKPLFIRHHAYANRYLTLIKNEAVANFWRDLPELLLYEGYRLLRTVVAEQDLIGGYRLAFRLAARAWEKRRNLRPGVRVASAEVRRWFQPDDYLGRLRQGP